MAKNPTNWLICPHCTHLAFKRVDVWYPDQPKSRLKCPQCGQWNVLADWEACTDARFPPKLMVAPSTHDARTGQNATSEKPDQTDRI